MPRATRVSAARLIEAHRSGHGVLRRGARRRPTRWPGRSSSTSAASTRPRRASSASASPPAAARRCCGHLRGKGFTDEEIVTAGLVARSNRGPYDRFRGRLLWPIRD